MAENQNTEFRVSGNEVLKKIKEIIKEGNARLIIIKNESGKEIFKFPITAGVFGIVFLPVFAAIGSLLVLTSNYIIEVEKK